MKATLATAATIVGLAAALLGQLHAQAPQEAERVRQIPAGRPGPITTDPKIINLPVPRMHDGKPDLTGPAGAHRQGRHAGQAAVHPGWARGESRGFSGAVIKNHEAHGDHEGHEEH